MLPELRCVAEMNNVPETPDRAGRDQPDEADTPTARFPTTVAVLLVAVLVAVILLVFTDVPALTVIGSILLFLLIFAS